MTLVLITPDRIELRGLPWFSDHWSREASYSRARRRTPMTFHLLAPGAVQPDPFVVRGARRHEHRYADGRRFLRCAATITTVPQHPTTRPQDIAFTYWEHDPTEEEPPVVDVESVLLPG
ncbi:hypothetical protein [Streptomyces murinus]|uniref:hypothetical protein n=1 Tax=Streptomyces murinus TaxID=33900 RepID=UPI0038247C13